MAKGGRGDEREKPARAGYEEEAEESGEKFSRRTSLKIAGGALIFFAGLGLAGKTLPGTPLLRPPGGQDPEYFRARCLKCGRCRGICPTSAIGAATLADSLADARTPTMKFRIGACDFCGKCVKACPTRALRPFALEIVKIGLATVQKHICIAWTRGGCTLCRNSCPYSAITVDSQTRPEVNPEKCKGCGSCEHICPALALRSYVGGSTRGIKIMPLS
jgi:ferredoxin-type protein NapG